MASRMLLALLLSLLLLTYFSDASNKAVDTRSETASTPRKLLSNNAAGLNDSRLDAFPTAPMTTTPTPPTPFTTTTPTAPFTTTPPTAPFTTTPTSPFSTTPGGMINPPATTTPTTPIVSPTNPFGPPTVPNLNPTTPFGSTPPTTGGSTTWCVAKPGVPDSALQTALDYACGLGGADCTSIQQGGPCYNPNTLAYHCSYAFDSYYKKNGMAPGSCDFKGLATITTQDPSTGTCSFAATSVSGGSSVLNTSIPGIGSGLPPSTTSSGRSMVMCTPPILTLLCLSISFLFQKSERN